MTLSKGKRIFADFRKSISEKPNLTVNASSISGNVIELSGALNHLLYVKVRADHPLRWGVTANIIDKLRKQQKPWSVILLFLEPNQGYFLPSNDVEHYIKNVWPKGNDGDYKPATGSYLARNKPFHTIDRLLEQLYRFSDQSPE